MCSRRCFTEQKKKKNLMQALCPLESFVKKIEKHIAHVFKQLQICDRCICEATTCGSVLYHSPSLNNHTVISGIITGAF
jgi:hypothetical protein